jgi:hypothetical protein
VCDVKGRRLGWKRDVESRGLGGGRGGSSLEELVELIGKSLR